MNAARTLTRIAAFADRALERLTIPRRRIGARVMRAILGSAIVLFYVQNIGWRRFIWGPEGLVPLSRARELVEKSGADLYLASASTAYFEFAFWAGLIAAVAFATGRWAPFSTIACAISTWSLLARDGYVGDSGWTLATLLLAYAVALDCGSALAENRHRFVRRAGALLHNFGVALILWQVSLVYGAACFYKATGHKWQDGTALYYILRSNQFDLTPLGAHVYHSALFVALGTYATLALQAAFPFCIWQRPAKYVVALAAMGFHAGIAYTMALPLFSLVMIASEAMLFSDGDYRAAFAILRGLGAKLAAALRVRKFVAEPATAIAALSTESPAVLIFDADCGMCTRFAGSRLVRSARIRAVGYQFVSVETNLAEVLRERAIEPQIFTSAMVLVAGSRVAAGADAFNAILRRRGGWYAIAGGVLSLPGPTLMERALYRAIAAHRGSISAWLGASKCATAGVRKSAADVVI